MNNQQLTYILQRNKLSFTVYVFFVVIIYWIEAKHMMYNPYILILLIGMSFIVILQMDKGADRKYNHSLIRFLEKCQSEKNVEKFIDYMIYEIELILHIKDVKAFYYDEKTNSFYDTNLQFSETDLFRLKIGEWYSTPTDTVLFIGESCKTYIYLYIPYPYKLSNLKKLEKDWLSMLTCYASVHLQNQMLIKNGVEEIIENHTSSDLYSPTLSRILFTLSEQERVKLSHNIHDSILQELIFIGRELESHLVDNHELVSIRNRILDNVQEVRERCFDLRPPFLLEMGLVNSIKILVDKYRKHNICEIEFFVNIPDDLKFTEEYITNIYRITQELLNNASKHSKADYIVLNLMQFQENIIFVYEDNGIGTDLQKMFNYKDHFGLRGIQERAKSMHSKYSLISNPNEGLLFKCELNLIAIKS